MKRTTFAIVVLLLAACSSGTGSDLCDAACGGSARGDACACPMAAPPACSEPCALGEVACAKECQGAASGAAYDVCAAAGGHYVEAESPTLAICNF